MKTFPTTQEIDQMAEKLRMAVVETLSLSESAKVFVGNEEKLFLMALFQKLPDSSHKTSIKFDRYKHLTNFKMMDIGSDEITNRSAIKKRQNLREKSRQLLISTRGFLIKIKNYIFLSRKLKNTSTIIHYAGHLRYGAFVTPNLTDLYFGAKATKDKSLRGKFNHNLKKIGLEPQVVEYLTHLFPTSHLELYFNFSKHRISHLKGISSVVTSIAGIMDDPLLSFLVNNNNSKLIYVQHGGGYGLNKNHVAYQIEEAGADLMYFWGTGDHNVYPTRYRKEYFSSIKSEMLVVLSDSKNEHTMDPFIRLAEIVINEKHISFKIAAHPNGPKFNQKIIQYGVGYQQHERAQLVVYDSAAQSLIYARVFTKRPFLILEEDLKKYVCQSPNGIKFISLLVETKILVSNENIEERLSYWMNFSPEEAQTQFELEAKPFLEHVLNQTKIQDIFQV